MYSSLFPFYIPISHKLSACDGEIQAIQVVLNYLTPHMDKFTNNVILSDSEIVIQSVSKTSLVQQNPRIAIICLNSKQNCYTTVIPRILSDLQEQTSRCKQKSVSYLSLKFNFIHIIHFLIKLLFKEESKQEIESRTSQNRQRK